MDLDLLVQVAHLYYHEQMTQQAIAKKLNMSRSLVSKLLAKAKEKGVVKITISDGINRPHQPLEAQLKKLFGLGEVIVVPADTEANSQKLAYLHGYNAGELPDSMHIKGDLSYNYFDKHGRAVNNTWNSLLIGLSLEEIRAIPEVICVADEVVKAESIYIAAKSGLIHTLITNEMVAQKTLWYYAKNYGLNIRYRGINSAMKIRER